MLIWSGLTAAATQKVLILHSYHQGLEWTDNVNDGIASVLKNRPGIELYYEYLDTKRNVGDEYSTKLLDLYRARSHRVTFDLAIVSDNAALEFIARYDEEFYNNTPVVFCGISNFTPEITNGLSQVTGVVETNNAEATLNLMLSLHPETEKITIVLDKSTTGQAIKQNLDGLAERFKDRVNVELLTNFTWQMLEKYIAGLGDKNLLYLLTVNLDDQDRFISYLDGLALIKEAASIPIYSSWDFYLGKGIVGGVLTSGFQQGRQAAEMGLRILDGEMASDIPVDNTPPTRAVLDYQIMQKFTLDTSRVPQGVEIINRPPGITDQLKGIPHWVWLSTGSVTALLIMAVIVLRIRQSLILRSNLLLDKKVKLKTRELEHANSKLKQMSITDPLTGLYNRRHTSATLSRLISESRQDDQFLSVLMLDIDHFKSVNDTHGHPFGDKVIVTVAKQIKAVIRKEDIAGRYGGEEFLILLPYTDYTDAMTMAQRIRRHIQALQWDVSDFRVAVSCGVASLDEQDEETLLGEADSQLYLAKKEGRNRVR